MSRSSRRDFLIAGGAAAAAVQLGGVSAIGTARAAAGLGGLRRRLRGRLVLPGEKAYPAAAQVWNVRFDVPPRAIAFCRTSEDVAEVIRFARENGWPIRARSGRHSFEAYCNTTGIVCDVSPMRQVIVDRERGTVRIGAGNDNQTVYEQLILKHGLAVPIGSCPTVGFGGLTLGGGMSGLARAAGLCVDNLVAAKVVLPDGRIVHADAHRHPDLFWALRGGGGGNFGIATEFTFRTRGTPEVVNFGIDIPWTQAVQGLGLFQDVIPSAPTTLSSASFRLTSVPPASGTGPNILKATLGGQWSGTESELTDFLQPFAPLGTPRVTPLAYAAAWIPTGCSLVGPSRPDRVTCTVPLYPNDQRSDFVDAPMSQAGLQLMVDWTERWPGGAGGHEGGIQIEGFGPGSAVNAVPADRTAFVHRDSLYHMVYLNFWGPDDPPSVAQANIAWVDDFYAAMRPHVSGYAYQNYIDRRLRTWRHAYYGTNYARLRRVKRTYDPDWLMRFPQGIEPARRRGPAFTG